MKQLTFPKPTVATRIKPSGETEDVRYGQYEAVMIVTENGLPVNRTKILIPPTHPVTEVVCVDGTKLLFKEPFYCIEERRR